MDLADPLRSLIPSLDAAVLEVLAGTESALTGPEISRLARRGSRQGHAVVLSRLVSDGLVRAEPAGRSTLYRLNRRHVLASSVVTAAAARRTIIERLHDSLLGSDPNPVHASVFGSFARGDAGPGSDIDLLVVRADGASAAARWSDRLLELEADVVDWTGNRLEYILLSSTDLVRAARRGEPVVDAVVADAITVIGPDLGALLVDLGVERGQRG